MAGSKIGNSGFYDILHDIAVAVDLRRAFFAVEFLQNRYDETLIDARVAAVWDANGKFVKIPQMSRRFAYRVKKEDISDTDDDWALLYFKFIVSDDSEALSPYYENFSRKFCTREEADGPYGRYWRYTLKL